MTQRSRIRYRAEDIWDTPEDSNRYEVIDGDLYVTPAPAWRHQRCLGRLYIIVGSAVYREGLGEIVPAPTGVVLDPDDGVQPDLLFIKRERLGIISARGVEGAPDLVVEVLSPSTEDRDRGIKMRRYGRAGVPHYWLMDTAAPAIETYRLGEQGYELTGTYGPGSVLRCELFPGLDIPVDQIWS